MTGNITSIRIVDCFGTEAGGRAIRASNHQEGRCVRDIKGDEKDECELLQGIIAIESS